MNRARKPTWVSNSQFLLVPYRNSCTSKTNGVAVQGSHELELLPKNVALSEVRSVSCTSRSSYWLNNNITKAKGSPRHQLLEGLARSLEEVLAFCTTRSATFSVSLGFVWDCRIIPQNTTVQPKAGFVEKVSSSFY